MKRAVSCPVRFTSLVFGEFVNAIMNIATRNAKDGTAKDADLSLPDVLVSPYAAAAAALAGIHWRRTSPGGVCKPGQDRLLLRLQLGRGCISRVPSGFAALHARQAGILQDAKPQERLPPGAPPRPAHSTALLHAHHSPASQGGLDSSSDRSSRDPPVSDGTKAWVADSFVEGQPLSDRRRGTRRRALTYDLTGDPPPKRVSTSSWDASIKPPIHRYLPEGQLNFRDDDENDE